MYRLTIADFVVKQKQSCDLGTHGTAVKSLVVKSWTLFPKFSFKMGPLFDCKKEANTNINTIYNQ